MISIEKALEFAKNTYLYKTGTVDIHSIIESDECLIVNYAEKVHRELCCFPTTHLDKETGEDIYIPFDSDIQFHNPKRIYRADFDVFVNGRQIDI